MIREQPSNPSLVFYLEHGAGLQFETFVKLFSLKTLDAFENRPWPQVANPTVD